MKLGFLVAALFIIGSGTAAAQLRGEHYLKKTTLREEYYLKKTTFARGEPVFLYHKETNEGHSTVQLPNFPDLDPEQPFCSGDLISVSRDPAPASASSCPSLTDSMCNLNGPLLPPIQIRPGESHVDRFLLNFAREINAPGDYLVKAQQVYFQNPASGKAKPTLLHFRVDGEAPPYPAGAYQLWIEQLRSLDRDKRLEAARVLASMAPPALEGMLLHFAEIPEFRRYAPLALYRLGSPQSMKALAALLASSSPGTSENMDAARYLAESGNQHWFPLLLDAAEKGPQISAYPAYAAELGGKKMLPTLVALAQRPDARLQAVMAMGATGSRAAIPILIELLKSPDPGIRDRAKYSLRLLTHRTASASSQKPDVQAVYIKWSQWWSREGESAPIFKDTECGEVEPLT